MTGPPCRAKWGDLDHPATVEAIKVAVCDACGTLFEWSDDHVLAPCPSCGADVSAPRFAIHGDHVHHFRRGDDR